MDHPDGYSRSRNDILDACQNPPMAVTIEGLKDTTICHLILT
jgi:hypothetical protein